jgi:hypothetical protein
MNGERSGDRGLAHTALAGDEEQPAIEEVHCGGGQVPKPIRRSESEATSM